MKLKKYTFWRFIAVCCAIFISCCFVVTIPFIKGNEKFYYELALIPVGIFMIYSLIRQMIFPLDLRIYFYWIFLFSLMCTAYGSMALGIIIAYCGYILGTEVRIFSKNKILKYAIMGVLYVLAFSFNLRKTLVEIGAVCLEWFFSFTAVFFTHMVFKHLLKRIKTDIFLEIQKADIKDYFDSDVFTKRDKEMLNEVLAGCKYEEIAINHKLSLSSVKKRLAFLYKKLGVTCQIDFLIKFSGKQPDEIEK